MRDDRLQSIALGGLLHDIGKLLQRANQKYYLDHSSIGAQFIEEEDIDLPEKEAVLDCIRYHHYKNLNTSKLASNNIAYIVYEADNISAGIDRSEYEDKGTQGAAFNRELPLHSIFDSLVSATKDNSEGNKPGASSAYFLRSLEENNPINYPIPLTETNIKALKTQYQEMEKTIEGNFKESWAGIKKGTVNSILQVLEATSSYIPSSTNIKEVADISLFDHSKLTAAIGCCMYLYLRDKKQTDNYKEWCFPPKRDENYFKLVSGDLSGIQDFIYTVASKGALKSLRARSFYLDVTLEHIVDEILESLELSRANLLYTGGGHFYLLMPNTGKTEEILQTTREKVNEWFLKNFGTLLYLAMAEQECSSNDLMNKDGKNLTSQVFKSLTMKLSKEKIHRYSPFQLANILDPNSDYNHQKDASRECKSCRSAHVEPRQGEGEDTCHHCQNFENVGRKLIKERQLALPVTFEKPEGKVYLELPSIDRNPRFLILERLRTVEENPEQYHRIYTKNHWLQGYGIATNLWVGDYVRESDISPDTIDFEELENKGVKGRQQGIRRLAVLRADVDNLGTAFTSGFRMKNASLSRYATLSRQLSLFFKHYVNKICRGDIRGEDGVDIPNFHIDPSAGIKDKYLAVVYSGGDDVFVVGAWDDVIDFSVDLRKAFQRFTGDALKFSAGIGFFRHSFPVYQMAQLTGDLEEAAKEYRNNTKNALALFGKDRSIRRAESGIDVPHVFSWDEFLNGVYPKVQFFLDHFRIIDEKKSKMSVSKTFFYKLLVLLRARNDSSSINLAKLAYTLARLEKPGDKEAQIRFNDMKNNIYQWAGNTEDCRQLVTAINLLVYLLRDRNEE